MLDLLLVSLGLGLLLWSPYGLEGMSQNERTCKACGFFMVISAIFI